MQKCLPRCSVDRLGWAMVYMRGSVSSSWLGGSGRILLSVSGGVWALPWMNGVRSTSPATEACLQLDSRSEPGS